MSVINFLLVIFIASANGRVAVQTDKLPDLSQNLINIDDNKLVTETLVTTEQVEIKNDLTNNEISNSIDEKSNEITTVSSKLDETTISSKLDETKDDLQKDANVTRVDNGTALILTTFIEENRMEEARNACSVNPDLFLGIKSYSGYLTVNKTYNSNLFFWYFPVEQGNVSDTPWIIWMQGGPGASSMTGLFDEIGPFTIDANMSLTKNPFTWNKNHSLVFIDNPVGTGFSFTNHRDGYATDMSMYGGHLYTAFAQLVQLFPELQTAPLYIAGESYAGKYVPALATQIHRQQAQVQANLKGIMVGNGYTSPDMLHDITRPFYNFGLLSLEQVRTLQPLVDGFNADVAHSRSKAAKEKWNALFGIILFYTHQTQAYNFLRDELPVGKYAAFLKRSEIKRAIHVGDIEFAFINVTVNAALAPEFLTSAAPLYEELLEHYRVLMYCGQLDQMLPCAFTSESYRRWQWSHAEEFLNASRYPYIFNTKLAGYYKTGGGFTEVVVRGAGHLVPLDAPAPAQDLIARWTQGQSLNRRFGALVRDSYVQEYIKLHMKTIANETKVVFMT